MIMIEEQKYGFSKWMMLLKFRKHRLVDTWSAVSPSYRDVSHTLENNNGERIRLREPEYEVLRNVICKDIH